MLRILGKEEEEACCLSNLPAYLVQGDLLESFIDRKSLCRILMSMLYFVVRMHCQEIV